jgi:hypothetical protein
MKVVYLYLSQLGSCLHSISRQYFVLKFRNEKKLQRSLFERFVLIVCSFVYFFVSSFSFLSQCIYRSVSLIRAIRVIALPLPICLPPYFSFLFASLVDECRWRLEIDYYAFDYISS